MSAPYDADISVYKIVGCSPLFTGHILTVRLNLNIYCCFPLTFCRTIHAAILPG